MKILFLIPPALEDSRQAERIFGCNYGIYSQPNIFFLYPATILKNSGHEIKYLDFTLEKAGIFEDFCRTQDFDIIFFYTVFLSKQNDLHARDILAGLNPATIFIFMGTEPTANPKSFVNERTFIIRGESEEVVIGIVNEIEKGMREVDTPGISYFRDSHVINNKTSFINDLDSLPFPDRSLLSAYEYSNPKLSSYPFTTMVASRGCSFSCYYCVPNTLSFAREIEFKNQNGNRKPPVRLRSAENVVNEFTTLAKQGYKAISFLDDQFVWGEERTSQICHGIKKSGVEWSCLARADMLQNFNLIRLMAHAGCKYIDIGIESFNQDILDYIGKNCKVADVYSAVDNLKRAGIEPELNILLASCPMETQETIEETFRELLRLDVEYVLISICSPFPSTEFYKKALEENWMVTPEYVAIDPMRESLISYPHLSKQQLERIVKNLYVRYYFRPSYLMKRVYKLKGWRDLKNKVKAGLSILER